MKPGWEVLVGLGLGVGSMLGGLGLACSEVASTLRSGRVHVEGESIMGVQYRKDATLEKATDGDYWVRYTCVPQAGFEDRCPCREVVRRVAASVVEEFVRQVLALQDEGESAKCCDHPWTEIELVFGDDWTERRTVAFEPIAIETVLSLKCP
ncbi:MAG: hypothetical protein NZ742_08115 [Acidobacteria bacterium]|nr:hypothetical protein [Acidobacteriota bacterium]MDW7984829.1 hypothetical protein [Acidobacteriota bacterium]